MTLSEKVRHFDVEPAPSATAGFDAVVDSIVRPVQRLDGEKPLFFPTIASFGEYLQSKAGLSCMVDMRCRQTKVGGNMANFGAGLAALGAQVSLVGTFGWPEIDPVYRGLQAQLITIAQTGACTAVEFDDGKVMLSRMDMAWDVDWDCIKSRVEAEKLSGLFTQPDIIGLLNWSEMVRSSGIWRGILQMMREAGLYDKSKWVCFDLTDFSSRSGQEVREAAELMNAFSTHVSTAASFNLNEAQLFYQVLLSREAPQDIGAIGDAIDREMKLDFLVIHPRDAAYGWRSGERVMSKGFFVEKPLLSTGGGDHFNSGLCYALAKGLPPEEALRMGCAVSGLYVRQGGSPTLIQLADFLAENGF